MSAGILLQNLLQPAVLFFLLGVAASLLRSDLELPQPAPKLLSLYLLFAIGFRGGVELVHRPLGGVEIGMLLFAVAMAAIAPIVAFAILRRKLDPANAAAIAAAYGSISAVTFVTATAFLDRFEVPFGGYLVAAMALMESPAIVVAVILLRRHQHATQAEETEEIDEEQDWEDDTERPEPAGIQCRTLLRESAFNGAVFLLTGSLLIGMLTGNRGHEELAPFIDGIFRGLLCLFLLDLGIVAARRLGDLRRCGVFLIGFGILFPLANAAIAILFSHLVGASHGDALLLTVLCASASYIAVPAAVRLAIPQANPGLYVTSALAITFPFNVIVGIPLYFAVIKALWS